MDFNSLKNVDNLKALAQSIVKDAANEANKVKDVNVEKFKSGFNTYFVEYLKNDFLKFDGRVSRHQYWMFTIYAAIIGFVLSVLFGCFLSSLALIVLGVGINIRRLHDINLSGWFVCVCLVPYYIGLIVLLLLNSIPGDKESNKFGSVAK